MSDARPHDEASEVEALTEQDEVQEGASPDAQGDVAETAVEGGESGSSGSGSASGDASDGEATDGSAGDSASDVGASADADASAAEPSVDETDDTGQDVEDAGTGTADTTDDPQLDAPD